MYHAEDILDNFVVEASDSVFGAGVEYDASIVKGRLCAKFPGRPTLYPTELVCTGEATGRYVYVNIPYDEQISICEIEVYGKRMYYSYAQVVLYKSNPAW